MTPMRPLLRLSDWWLLTCDFFLAITSAILACTLSSASASLGVILAYAFLTFIVVFRIIILEPYSPMFLQPGDWLLLVCTTLMGMAAAIVVFMDLSTPALVVIVICHAVTTFTVTGRIVVLDRPDSTMFDSRPEVIVNTLLTAPKPQPDQQVRPESA